MSHGMITSACLTEIKHFKYLTSSKKKKNVCVILIVLLVSVFDQFQLMFAKNNNRKK